MEEIAIIMVLICSVATIYRYVGSRYARASVILLSLGLLALAVPAFASPSPEASSQIIPEALMEGDTYGLTLYERVIKPPEENWPIKTGGAKGLFLVRDLENFPGPYWGTFETEESIPANIEVSVSLVPQEVKWTVDMDETDEDFSNGHAALGLVVGSGDNILFQVHSNDGTCPAYDWGTWLYSEYDPTGGGYHGWHTSEENWNTPIENFDGISATGKRNLENNPDLKYSVTISKELLTSEFKWAMALMGDTSNTYTPENFGWSDENTDDFHTATFNIQWDEFYFEGYGLEPNTEYTLVYYGDIVDGKIVDAHNDNWPYATCIRNGRTGDNGRIEIGGFSQYIDNLLYYEGTCQESPGMKGAKIWLVKSSDINCKDGEMVAWNPEDYLFESDTLVNAVPMPWVDDFFSQMYEAYQKIENLENEIDTLENEKIQLSEDKALLQEQVENLEGRIAELESENILSLEQEVADKEDRIKSLEGTIDDKNAEIESLEDEVSDKNRLIARKRATITDLKGDLSETESKLFTAQTRARSAGTAFSRLEMRMAMLSEVFWVLFIIFAIGGSSLLLLHVELNRRAS